MVSRQQASGARKLAKPTGMPGHVPGCSCTACKLIRGHASAIGITLPKPKKVRSLE